MIAAGAAGLIKVALALLPPDVRAALKADQAGPYVLPAAYVGTWEDRGFEVDGTRKAVKLRLDAIPQPTRIDLPAARGWYRFDRKVPIELPAQN